MINMHIINKWVTIQGEEGKQKCISSDSVLGLLERISTFVLIQF